MRFGELFELLITLLIFLVIWILPRIMAARAADRKRRKRSGVKTAVGKTPETVSKSSPEPKKSWSKEIFSKLIDDSFFETDRKKSSPGNKVPGDVRQEIIIPETPAESVSIFEEEKRENEGGESEDTVPSEQEYQWDQEKRPLSELKAVQPRDGSSPRRRSALQKAVIWKELLDSPKALRRDPFP